ncbi:MAG: IS91 family transposase, partial [Thermoanaerobaculia bacterium]
SAAATASPSVAGAPGMLIPRRFIIFHNKRHPSSMGADEINAYLTHLAVEGHVSASTQNQALSAILFLYGKVLEEEIGRVGEVIRAHKPRHLPVVLTRDEVARILACLEGTWWVMGMLLYGSGLRQIECLRLRVKDVDLKRCEIRVRDGKGGKDRVTTLPETLAGRLGKHVERLRELAEEDRANRVPGVWLPDALARKYPNAGREWAWHIHCVIPGGGFSADATRWIGVRKPTFFLPVKVLSRRFRTHLCLSLRQAWHRGVLEVPARVLANAAALDRLLARVVAKEWVVYAKAPFGGPPQVLAYLANYTHRIAISNSRILSFDGERVSFRYRDYAHANVSKTMTLEAGEFLRRFLMHVVPSRFVRIRYYGFMANRFRANSIERARVLLGARTLVLTQTHAEPLEQRCLQCGQGVMRIAGPVEPQPSWPLYEDSS